MIIASYGNSLDSFIRISRLYIINVHTCVVERTKKQDGKGGDSGAYGLTVSEEKGDSQYSYIPITEIPFDTEQDTTFYTEQFTTALPDKSSCAAGGGAISGTNDIFFSYVVRS